MGNLTRAVVGGVIEGGGKLTKLADDFASRMARAKEQGYLPDTYYRGMDADVTEFTKSKADHGNVFLTPDSNYASSPHYGGTPDGGVVYPSRVRGNIFDINNPEMAARLRREKGIMFRAAANGDVRALQKPAIQGKIKEWGFDGYTAIEPNGEPSIAMFDPSNIRSVNAQFDPTKRGSSDLLASTIPAALGIGALAGGEDAEAGVITKGGKRLIESWHGTPHSFDRFDMSKLGSGEGAQAYGHGLYTADSKKTAQGYRSQLADAAFPNGDERNAAVRLIEAKGQIGENQFRGIAQERYGDEAAEQMIQDAKKVVDEGRGSLYKVHIDATPEELLDWDKPLSEQSQQVQDIAKNLDVDASGAKGMTKGVLKAHQEGRDVGKVATGQDLYRALSGYGDNAQEGSKVLSDAGLKGIQYNDAMSRGAEGGTKNYVTFDDKLMSIVERGAAQPGLLAGIAGGSLAGLGIGTAYTRAEHEANQRALQGLHDVDAQAEQDRLSTEYDKYPELDRFATGLEQVTTPSQGIDPNMAMSVGGMSNPLLSAYGMVTSESPLSGFTEYLRRMGADRGWWERTKDAGTAALDLTP